MRRVCFKNRNGSLLIEVLLTVVVVSVSLSIVIGGLLSGYRVSLLNSDYSQAMAILENQMAYWRSQGFSDLTVQKDSMTGVSEKFQMDVRSDALADQGSQGLKSLYASFHWKSGSKNTKILITTFFPENAGKR